MTDEFGYELLTFLLCVQIRLIVIEAVVIVDRHVPLLAGWL